MKNNKYISAFGGVKPNAELKENIINMAYSQKKAKLSKKVAFVPVFAAAVTILSLTALAAQLTTGSILGFLIEPSPDTSVNATVLSAQENIDKSVTNDNVKITLDNVITDKYSIYAVLDLETADKSALFKGVDYSDFDLLILGYDFNFGNDNSVFDNRKDISKYGDFYSSSNSVGSGGTQRRIDDTSDPSKAKIAVMLRYDKPIADFKTSDKVKLVINSVYGDVPKDRNGNFVKGGADFIKLAEGNWEFSFTLPNSLNERHVTADYHGNIFDITLTPLAVSYTYDPDPRLGEGHNAKGEATSADATIQLVTPAGNIACNGGSTRHANKAIVSDSGKNESLFSLAEVIDPATVTQVIINGEIIPVVNAD